MGFPDDASGKESTAKAGDAKDRVHPWARKILWSRKWHPTLVFLPRKFYGQRTPPAYSPWGRRVRHD